MIVKKKRLALSLLLCCALLAACGESSQTPSKSAAPDSKSSEPAFDRVAAQAAGFAVGNMMAARVVYVFFDSQCPHCAALWRASRPLLGQIRMVWIPVRLLNDLSGRQGAALLASRNPEQEMDTHERIRDTGGQGLVLPERIPEEALEKVRANTALMSSLGAGEVPYLVYKNPANGLSATQSGASDTEGLKRLLGL